MAQNSIRYIYNPNMGMELIFCENSTVSYPTHNHVSVLTIGIVLDGSIVLAADNTVKVYEKNQSVSDITIIELLSLICRLYGLALRKPKSIYQ